MASVRAPISSVAAIRPLSRGQAPVLGEEDLRRRWRDDTLVSGRNFTPGRQKSLGAHGAPSCAARQGSRRGVLVLTNESQRSRRSACASGTPDPGIEHLLSAAPFQSHRLSRPVRDGPTVPEVLVVRARQAKRVSHLRRGWTLGSVAAAPYGVTTRRLRYV